MLAEVPPFYGDSAVNIFEAVVRANIRFSTRIFKSAVIKKKYRQYATNVGDEGGFAPNIQDNKEGLELLKTAIANASYTRKVVIGMDVAALKFYDNKGKTYDLNFKEEDPFDQDDWENYSKLIAEIGQ
ncbi:hypothetical protein RJT34_11626 [Clitoria ternatea]|uniref:phosphopyruvate hydratase n=1 Tax=Clitoria ternatea TaxID=43366 RepID=A0AAN9JM82_CLITE